MDKRKKDDPEQSKWFRDMAKEVEADKDEGAGIVCSRRSLQAS
jgi:hypothetical protein